MTPAEAAGHAAELHRKAIVIDCHSDILMPIADGLIRLGTDVEIPDPARWKPPFEIVGTPSYDYRWPLNDMFGCIGQYSLPKFVAGGLTAQVCAAFVEDHQLDHALKRALQMVYWLHREAKDNPGFELVKTAADIRRLKAEGKCGGILALEGLEPVGPDLNLLDIFYELGLRMASLTHNRKNYFADGTLHYVKAGGLSDAGRQAVKRMNELGIVVDVCHIDQEGFLETLEISTQPVVLSHRSPLKYFPLRAEDSPFHPAYNVTRGRERLEALARNGGVFGVFFLSCKDVDDVVADIEHVIGTVGPDYVGLGSDLYGLQSAPKGLEDISKVPALTEALVRRGHSDEVILKVLGENFMRVFEQAWKDRA
ncbi:MAG: membrane dipeptidase [Armatimonadota bacterium]|jgi:membrane dipeptidase